MRKRECTANGRRWNLRRRYRKPHRRPGPKPRAPTLIWGGSRRLRECRISNRSLHSPGSFAWIGIQSRGPSATPERMFDSRYTRLADGTNSRLGLIGSRTRVKNPAARASDCASVRAPAMRIGIFGRITGNASGNAIELDRAAKALVQGASRRSRKRGTSGKNAEVRHYSPTIGGDPISQDADKRFSNHLCHAITQLSVV